MASGVRDLRGPEIIGAEGKETFIAREGPGQPIQTALRQAFPLAAMDQISPPVFPIPQGFL